MGCGQSEPPRHDVQQDVCIYGKRTILYSFLRGLATSPSANEGVHALDRQVDRRKRAASPPEKNDARDTRRSHTIFRDLRRFGPRRPPDRRARATQNKGRAGLMVANDHVGHPISSRSRPYTPRTAHASQEAARSHTPNAVFRAGTCTLLRSMWVDFPIKR